jgi:hypothetical protein
MRIVMAIVASLADPRDDHNRITKLVELASRVVQRDVYPNFYNERRLQRTIGLTQYRTAYTADSRFEQNERVFLPKRILFPSFCVTV